MILSIAVVIGVGLGLYFIVANIIDLAVLRLAIGSRHRLSEFRWVESAGAHYRVLKLYRATRPVIMSTIIFGGGMLTIRLLGLSTVGVVLGGVWFFFLAQSVCLGGRSGTSVSESGGAMIITVGLVIVAYIASTAASDRWGPLAETRDGFHTIDLPTRYPVLLSHLMEHGPLTVTWRSGSGMDEHLVVSADTRGDVALETTIPVTNETSAGVQVERLAVTFLDRGADGNLDQVVYRHADGSLDTLGIDDNDDLDFLWDSCLAIAFVFGEPFCLGRGRPTDHLPLPTLKRGG